MSIEKYEDRENWLDTFAQQRPDLFYPESWSDAEKAEVVEEVRPANIKMNMFASIPMKCRGSKCPVKASCPLWQKNLAPEGLPCPIESSMVREFMTSLIAELNVNPENMIEVSMIRDLVDQEVQYQRKVWILSQEDFIQENVVGIDDSGQPILQKGLHQAVEMEDRLLKRKKDIRNQLVATREARAKAGLGNLDTAQELSNAFEALRDVQIAKDKVLKEKLGKTFEDEYIIQSEAADSRIIDAEIVEE